MQRPPQPDSPAAPVARGLTIIDADRPELGVYLAGPSDRVHQAEGWLLGIPLANSRSEDPP